jgi:hypothetical protein
MWIQPTSKLLSALGGAAIGGLTSFGSSWLTQRAQLRFTHLEAIKAKREELYAEFVDEAARLYGDALGHQKDDAADEVCHIFSQRGAYSRYKDLLVRRGALERWYDFSNKSEEAALREWCVENGIDLSESWSHAVAIHRWP